MGATTGEVGRRTRGFLAGVLAAAGLAATAGIAGAQPINAQAISPTDAIGLDVAGGCPQWTNRIMVSHDRGVTFTPGACIGASDYSTSAGPGSLNAPSFSSNEIIRIGADGSVSSVQGSPPVEMADASVSRIASSADGAGVYVLGSSAGGPNAWWRPWSGASRACAPLTIPSGRAAAIHVGGADWVAVVISTDTLLDRGAALLVSGDACRSWRTIQLPEDLAPLGITDTGALVAQRSTPTGGGAFQVLGVTTSSDQGETWTAPAETRLLPAADGRFVYLDRLSSPGFPGGWPAAPGLTVDNGAVPAGEKASMLAWLNARFRSPLGLPQLAWDASLELAASRHAAYVAANGGYGAQGSPHFEQPARSGFTGVDHAARISAAGGYSEDSSEGMSGSSNLPAGISGLTNAPYHGFSFFNFAEIGFGSSKDATVVNYSHRRRAEWSSAYAGQRVDPIAGANGPEAPVRMWPYDGAALVPTAFGGGENPDPLRAYAGSRPVGSPMYVWSAFPGARASVTGPAGPIALLPLGAAAAEASPALEQGWNAYLPVSPFAIGPSYTLRVSVGGRTYASTFTAGNDGGPPGSGGAPAFPSWVKRAKVAQLRVATNRARWRVSVLAAGPGRVTFELAKAKGPRTVLRRVVRPARAGVMRKVTATFPRMAKLGPGRYVVRATLRLTTGQKTTLAKPVRKAAPKRR